MKSRKEYKVVIPRFSPRAIAVWGEGHDIERKTLEKAGATLVELDTGSEEGFIEGAKDADALLYPFGGISINRKIIESFQKCKIIALPSVGYDSVDISAATDHGIWVTNTPDVFIEEVADHTMMLILASWRRLITQDNVVRSGRWLEARPMLNQFPRLMGTTLGFVAFGNIPRAVSCRAKPFGFRLMAYDPHISELDMIKYGVEPITELSELLERSDFISVHLPLSNETHHMMSEQQFKQMKSTAILINTGRGSTIDEAALIKALQEGWIAFAGLDVFEKEPIEPNNPLLKMENVILTSHVASASSRMPSEARRRAAHEVARVLQGEYPISPVNRIVP